MSIVNQEIQRLSETDALTGLGNRRALDAILKHEMTNIFQVSGNISVLIIDIDYFKGFNDTYGHLAGDDCLRCIAEVIQKAFTILRTLQPGLVARSL
jgi:diguanylate cyclase (GGDEF)-like protein